MIRTFLAVAGLSVMGVIGVACSSGDDALSDPKAPSEAADTNDEDASASEYTWDHPTGDVGTAERKASGKKCCYKDKFYTCDSTVDCFGGFDFEACVTACGDDDDCAYGKCREAFFHAPPPTSKCVEGELPKVPETKEEPEGDQDTDEAAEPVDEKDPTEDDLPFSCDYSQ